MLLFDVNSLFSGFSDIMLEIRDLLKSGLIAEILMFDGSIPYSNVYEDSYLILFNLLQFILFFFVVICYYL
jgi:hypothetical protein